MLLRVRLFSDLNKHITKRCLPFLHNHSCRPVSLQPISSTDGRIKFETFEQKNFRLKRPLSPHLQIYQPQLTWVLSIFHRITGVAVTGYAAIIGATGFFKLENMIIAINNLELSSVTLVLLKTVLALPVSYHIFNGIRHLIWDVGKGLTIKGVYTSGYFVCASTIFISLYLASL